MIGLYILLAHLVGDYILQTDRMAREKTRSSRWAFIHAAVYAACYAPLAFYAPRPLFALYVILVTHFFIDRYRLARYVVEAKNWITDPWINRVTFWRGRGHVYVPARNPNFATSTGYDAEAPAWMTVWLFIIADNTLHLLINTWALQWQ